MPKDNKESIIGIRVTLDQKKELQKLANAEGRTLSNFIVYHLEKLLKSNKK